MPDTLRFLGTGSATSEDLPSAAVLECGGRPLLLIDCGPGVLRAFRDRYVQLPPAVFVTHLHMDHVAGLEALFYAARTLSAEQRPRLFVPVSLVAPLHARLAEFPNLLAEGGANFWDVLQLVPVSADFWWQGLRYDAVPVRHHSVHGAYGLGLRGRLLYTGDTRPIPEVLIRHGSAGEWVFHDCSPTANPSHTGLADLQREYSPAMLARMVLYHYPDQQTAADWREAGFRVAAPGECFPLGGDGGS
ncbi:MAG: ribonuclease Z [Xanthomonadales bacterium]|nr:ribonuclease Z [Xanthomonadales bacterium]MCB1628600.1 ribonuclease Z [Xanthomonadales bacterium]MCB1633345.1 ribonuclease Z [Xanthomonadales bacterium]MCB1640282.1 ribonuclease Z [Xanthomonadales bacterium]